MREIEFRGKIKETGEWVYGTLLRIPAPPQCMGSKKTDTYFIQFKDQRYMPDWNMPYSMVQAEINPETIGQYVGLKDKNGKKIFEGDIVKAFYFETEVIGKIEFIYGTFALTNSCISDNQLFIFEKLEVVGNIYDNPELLEVQDE